MDITKFKEVQKLMDKIQKLEKCINSYKKYNSSRIAVENEVPYKTTVGTRTIYETIPQEYEEEIINLLKDKLEELKVEFNKL